MAVVMKRSTKMAPDSLSTSYLIGSAFIGISMTTLKVSGAFLPGVRLLRDMSLSVGWKAAARAAGLMGGIGNIGINPDFRRGPAVRRRANGGLAVNWPGWPIGPAWGRALGSNATGPPPMRWRPTVQHPPRRTQWLQVQPCHPLSSWPWSAPWLPWLKASG